MTFLIVDTFTDSLARLPGDEKAVKTTALRLRGGKLRVQQTARTTIHPVGYR
jgi:hypothetical protein